MKKVNPAGCVCPCHSAVVDCRELSFSPFISVCPSHTHTHTSSETLIMSSSMTEDVQGPSIPTERRWELTDNERKKGKDG